MSELWIATIAVLWLVALVSLVLSVGTLRQVGVLRLHLGMDRQSGPTAAVTEADVEESGPDIGSSMVEMDAESVNGHGRVRVGGSSAGREMLIAFMAPGCEGCQHAAAPLDEIAGQRSGDLQAILVLRGDDYAARAFASVYSMHTPVIADANREITRAFGVTGNPYALLYDRNGRLIRKGLLDYGRESVLALLGDEGVAEPAQRHIFPPQGAVAGAGRHAGS